MKTKKIRYNPQTDKRIKKFIENSFNEFGKKWGRGIIKNKQILSFSNYHSPNWACIFNNPEFIDKPCVIIATDDEFCLVTFDGNLESAQFYRCEDIKEVKK